MKLIYFIRNGQIRLLCFCFAYCSLWKRKPPFFHQEMLLTHQTSQGYVTAATCNQSSSAILSWQTFVWPLGKFRKIFTNLWKVFKISTNVVNMYCECSVKLCGRFQIQKLSSVCSLVKYFSTLKDKFPISAQSYNILYLHVHVCDGKHAHPTSKLLMLLSLIVNLYLLIVK